MTWIRKRSLVLWILIWAVALMGCKGLRAGSGTEDKQAEGGDFAREHKKKVVTTVFPYYDFVRQIAGDHVELTLVVPAGMDSHSFEPTPADMRAIQNGDILICNGGSMEHWLMEVLDAIDTSHMEVVTMMDYVDVVEEELVEGMEEEAHDHFHGESDRHDEGYEPRAWGTRTKNVPAEDGPYVDDDGHHVEIEYDEHIWTSPINAIKLIGVIEKVLAEQDPAHAFWYKENAGILKMELERIDQGFRQVSESRRRNLIVVGDKFPFRYLAEEYGIDYRAAFSGCSTDTEPSARTIAYLIDKVSTDKIPVVYFLETGSQRVARIIGEETGAKPLLLHSCHTVTRRQFEEGITYVELMEQNIENLRKGLDE